MRQILDFVVYYRTVTAALALAGGLAFAGAWKSARAWLAKRRRKQPYEQPFTHLPLILRRRPHSLSDCAPGGGWSVRQRMLRRVTTPVATIDAGQEGKRARSGVPGAVVATDRSVSLSRHRDGRGNGADGTARRLRRGTTVACSLRDIDRPGDYVARQRGITAVRGDSRTFDFLPCGIGHSACAGSWER